MTVGAALAIEAMPIEAPIEIKPTAMVRFKEFIVFILFSCD